MTDQPPPIPVEIERALAEHAAGKPITATCAACTKTLVVTDVEATGALVIACPDGHVSFRTKRAPAGDAGDDPVERAEYERELEHFERTKHVKPLKLD